MKELIKDIVDLSYKSKEGHIPSSLSVLDIIYVIYKEILNTDELTNNVIDRDRFILSKGHGSMAIYTVMKHLGLMNENVYNSFCQFDSALGGHPDTNKFKLIEASTGSLGHGLPIGIGMALGYKIKKIEKKVFVVIGDGESNEGTTWEAALLASYHNLNNLYCIMDYNHSGDRALKIDNVINKFKAFNWKCIEIDGHDQKEIKKVLTKSYDKPVFILANTIKGKGVKIMENNPEWHHKHPNEEEYKKIMDELWTQ